MKSDMTSTKRLDPAAEGSFAEIFDDVRKGLSDAIDLVLIHNERPVRGNQPRATLNPLTLLLSVAAWERFIADTSYLAAQGSLEAVGHVRSAGGGAYLNGNGSGGAAARALGALTDGALPSGFRVRVFESWVGKDPRSPRIVTGEELGVYVDDAIRHRNGVAHRALPRAAERAVFTSDARKHTVQAGWARAVVAMFVQAIDQASQFIGESAGFQRSYRLPSAWFEPEPASLRGVEQPGALWGGYDLIR